MLKLIKSFFMFIILFVFIGTVNAMPYDEEYRTDKFSNNEVDKINTIINAYNTNGIVDGYVGVGLSKLNNLSKGLVIKYDTKLKIEKEVTNDCNCSFSTIIPSYSNEGLIDGYIAVASLDYSVLLVKYDLDLNVVNKSTYNSGKVSNIVIDYSYNTNGNVDGYILLASGFSYVNYSVDAFIYKFDLDMKFLWKNTVSSFKEDTYTDIVPSYNGDKVDGFLLIGKTYNNGDVEFIQKLDLDGKSVWNKNIAIKDGSYKITDVTLSYENNVPTGIMAVANNVIVSNGQSFSAVAKIRFDGTIENVVEMTDFVNSGFKQIIASKDEKGNIDGYILAGYIDFITKKENPKSLLMIKIDNEMKINWSNVAEGFRYYKKIMYGYNSAGVIDGIFTLTADTENDAYLPLAIKYDYKEYNINSKAIHGEVIPSMNTSKEGDIIVFEVNGENNCALDSIKVFTASGIEVDVTNNSFTMPDEDVLIEVIYEPIVKKEVVNPNTIGGLMILLFISLGVSIAMLIHLKNNRVSIV